MENKGLSLHEARKIVGVSYPTMLNLVNSEGFPSFRVGRKWIIPAEQLHEWIRKQVKTGGGSC